MTFDVGVSMLPLAVATGSTLAWALVHRRRAGRIDRERRRLQQHGLRLQRLLDLSSEGFVVLEEGRLAEANYGIERMFGRPLEELRGRPLEDLLPPGCRDTLAAALARGDGAPVEVLGMRPDGQTFPLRLGVFGPGGELVVIRDISEHRRVEADLRDQEERFRSLTDGAADAIISADDAGRILSWNAGARVLFGYSAEEVLGRSLTMLMPERHRRPHQDGVEHRAAGGAPRLPPGPVEVQGLRRDGSELPLELMVSEWSHGGRRYFGGILRDITERKRVEGELRESEARFRSLTDAAADAIVSADAEGRVIFWNAGAAAIFGYQAHEIVGQPLTLLMPERFRAAHQEGMRRLADGGEPRLRGQVVEVQGLRRDGREFPLELTVSSWRQGQQIFFGGILRDISERRRVEAELRDSEERFRSLTDAAADAIVSADADGKIISWNAGARAIFGYQPDEVVGRSLTMLMPHRYRAAHEEGIRRLVRGGAPRLPGKVVAVQGLRRDGREFPLELTVSTWTQGGRMLFGGILRDISEQERIARLAHHDALTDLPNGVLFQDRLSQALARANRSGESVAVLHLCLDGFKEVTDVFGGATGDALVQEVGRRLLRSVREGDTVARLGDETFAIVQVGLADPASTRSLITRLFGELAQPVQVDGREVLTSACIGAAVAPRDGSAPDQLVRSADIALSRAKAEGRSTFRFFEQEMDARLRARRLLEQRLRQALAQGGLEIHYQPQVDLARGEVVGFEALVRWPDPEHGDVSPAEFIPLAEETGLILPLGDWVLRRACEEAAAWPRPYKIAVNLSPIQFRRGDPAELVTTILDATGLDPRRLELELTEGTLMRDSNDTLAVLGRLKETGVRFVMDDFGTGYSSLSYLRRFPFDKIKIDKSFIHGLTTNPDDAAIVKATLGLGRSLALMTTAEGVETHEQAAYLRAQGCTQAQGFLYGRPAPAAELGAVLRAGRVIGDGHPPGAAPEAGERRRLAALVGGLIGRLRLEHGRVADGGAADRLRRRAVGE